MASIENRVTANGDVLLIRAEVPIVGLIYLTDFIDNTDGEDGSTYFRKEFRYSTDGINFTPWAPLTNANLSAVEVRPSDTFFIEYRYTRVGNGSQELSFTEIDVNGTRVNRECGPVYKQSIFADFFSCSDTEVLGWAINVTEKLYRKGLMPSFVERGNQNSSLADRDYLDFWRSVAQFFAIIVVYARQLERIHANPQLLREYLRQWGLFGLTELSLDQLAYLLEHSRDQFRQRGTMGIVARERDGAPVDGELLRLLGYRPDTDEFLLNVVEAPYAGWCMGWNAPTYNGVGSQRQLNKGYEKGGTPENIGKYPVLVGQGLTSIQVQPDGRSAIVMENVGTGQKCGIGGHLQPGSPYIITDNPSSRRTVAPIVVNPCLTYEITFTVQVTVAHESVLSFGCLAYDEGGNAVPLVSMSTGRGQSWFFERGAVNNDQVEYQVRGLIYQYAHPNVSPADARLAFGTGQHLRFKANVRKIVPQIIFDNEYGYANTAKIKLFNFRVAPCSSPRSLGFVDGGRFVQTWMQNRNSELSENQLSYRIAHFLLPYNATFLPVFIPDAAKVPDLGASLPTGGGSIPIEMPAEVAN